MALAFQGLRVDTPGTQAATIAKRSPSWVYTANVQFLQCTYALHKCLYTVYSMSMLLYYEKHFKNRLLGLYCTGWKENIVGGLSSLKKNEFLKDVPILN